MQYDYKFVSDFISSMGYTLINKDYKNANQQLILKCPNKHFFHMSFNDFYYDYGICPVCRNECTSLTDEEINKEIPSYKSKQKINYYRSYKYRKIHSRILKRDNYKCTKCGCNIKADLDVHHIKHREDGGTNEDNNLITLCRSCHAEAHKGEPCYSILVARIRHYKIDKE